jgi:hypothetical protein
MTKPPRKEVADLFTGCTFCFGSRADVFQRSRCANAIYRAAILLKGKNSGRSELASMRGRVLLVHFNVLPSYLSCLRYRPQNLLFAPRSSG